MNTFGKTVDIIVFCIIGFLLPAILIALLADEVKDTTADVKLREFAENVSTKGYVSREMYENFLLEMNQTGVVVFPKLCTEHELFAPEYRMRTIGDAQEYLEALYRESPELSPVSAATERPVVVDLGKPVGSVIMVNLPGVNPTVSGPAVGHTHTEDCYTGTMHTHTAACTTIKAPCTAGCARHTHSGSSWGGGGCYTTHVPSYSYVCGTKRNVTKTTDNYQYSYCSNCEESRTHRVEIYKGICDGCGGEYVVSHRATCSKCGDIDMYDSEIIHTVSYSGYYSLGCGLDISTYYKDGSICSICNGTGQMDKVACTKENGKYYDALGNECAPVCSQVVTNIAPIVKEQALTMGTQPDKRVLVTFLDGHTEVVEAAVSGFDGNAINTLQNITLSHGVYRGTAKNPGQTSCTVKLTVLYKRKTCLYGHTYFLYMGEDTPCPYCKAYPQTLTVLGAVSPFHIRKGTTLADNGVRIKVTYHDGQETIITSGWKESLDRNYVGFQTVTIGYLGATTTLDVVNDRLLVHCSVCDFEYALYPDDSNPGCPKCLSAIPVFTGNVLHYKETKSAGEILDELYYGSGIVYFTKGDRLELRLKKSGRTSTNTVLTYLFGGGLGEETISLYSVNIRDEVTSRLP